MSGLCLAVGLLIVPLGNSLTLTWTHSIEKIVWEEEYRREGTGLRLSEARVRGTGAGMEPPAGAVLHGGSWRYRPDLPLLPQVQLRHSPHVPPYTLCVEGHCQGLPEWLPGLPEDAVVTLLPCSPASPLPSSAVHSAGKD